MRLSPASLCSGEKSGCGLRAERREMVGWAASVGSGLRMDRGSVCMICQAFSFWFSCQFRALQFGCSGGARGNKPSIHEPRFFAVSLHTVRFHYGEMFKCRSRVALQVVIDLRLGIVFDAQIAFNFDQIGREGALTLALSPIRWERENRRQSVWQSDAGPRFMVSIRARRRKGALHEREGKPQRSNSTFL